MSENEASDSEIDPFSGSEEYWISMEEDQEEITQISVEYFRISDYIRAYQFLQPPKMSIN